MCYVIQFLSLSADKKTNDTLNIRAITVEKDFFGNKFPGFPVEFSLTCTVTPCSLLKEECKAFMILFCSVLYQIPDYVGGFFGSFCLVLYSTKKKTKKREAGRTAKKKKTLRRHEWLALIRQPSRRAELINQISPGRGRQPASSDRGEKANSIPPPPQRSRVNAVPCVTNLFCTTTRQENWAETSRLCRGLSTARWEDHSYMYQQEHRTQRSEWRSPIARRGNPD